jgi:hypothetical protein
MLAGATNPQSQDQEQQEGMYEVEEFAVYVYLADRLIDGATKGQLADQLVVRQFQSDLNTKLQRIVRDRDNLFAQLQGQIAGTQSRLDHLLREVTRANTLFDEYVARHGRDEEHSERHRRLV